MSKEEQDDRWIADPSEDDDKHWDDEWDDGK